jgi:hypothetical protein
MCESRGQFGSSDRPRVVPWAQSVISKWTGFSRFAAAVLLPRRLLAAIPQTAWQAWQKSHTLPHVPVGSIRTLLRAPASHG